MGANSIPAYDRYNSGNIFSNICGNISTIDEMGFKTEEKVIVFPNPIQNEINIESLHFIRNLTIINLLGQKIYYQENIGISTNIKTVDWENGLYFLLINFANNKSTSKVVVKI